MPRIVLIGLTLPMFFLVTCGEPAGFEENDIMTGEKATLLTEPPIWNSVSEIQQACSEHLAAAEALRSEIKAVAGRRLLENTLRPFNLMLVEINRILPLTELIANVHPDKVMRAEAEQCQQQAMKLHADIELDHDLYQAVAGVSTRGLDTQAKRFLDRLLIDFRLAGVDKDEETRARLSLIKEEMVKVGQDFSRNIREDKRSIQIRDPKDLAGLPADFVAAHPADEQGVVSVSTDYPDYVPFVNYADNEQLRKDLQVAFLSRAYPANDAIFARLLMLRYQYATLLGFDNWADYNAADKMVKNARNIADFIDQVADYARPSMRRDLDDLLARKRQDLPAATEIGSWDRFYYLNKVQEERFGVDPQEVRAHFEFHRVKQGLLDLAQELYEVTFVPVADAPRWHAQVEAYDVYRGDKLAARFYLDLHPREGKYGHMAEFGIYTGVTGVQLPSASLVCNFTDPSLTAGPALMEHGDVVTFFHEFGHLMHQLMGGDHAWVTLSGINCEWDFVETPSQVFEEWAWDPDVLARFASHHETGRPIPAALVRKMRDAAEFGKGVHVMRQMYYAALSYGYHSRNPEGMDLMAVVLETGKSYSPFSHIDQTYDFASFGHLEGYSSMYYTYMWSLVLTKDIATKLKAYGLLDANIFRSYRQEIVEPGGTVDAEEMVRNFLGRPHSIDAFRDWLEKS